MKMPCRCPICFDDIAFHLHEARPLAVTPCGHLYHEQCISQWFARTTGEAKKQCPLCRKPCTTARLVRLFADFYTDAAGRNIDTQAVDGDNQENLNRLAEMQLKYQNAARLHRECEIKLKDNQAAYKVLDDKYRKTEQSNKVCKKEFDAIKLERDKALRQRYEFKNECDELLADNGQQRDELRQLRKTVTFFNGDEKAVVEMFDSDATSYDPGTYKILLLQAKRNMDQAVDEARMLQRNNAILLKQIADARDLGMEKQRAVTALEALLNQERSEAIRLRTKLAVGSGAVKEDATGSCSIKRSLSQTLLGGGDLNSDSSVMDDDTYQKMTKALIASADSIPGGDMPTPENIRFHPVMRRLRQEYPAPRISLNSSAFKQVDAVSDDKESDCSVMNNIFDDGEKDQAAKAAGPDRGLFAPGQADVSRPTMSLMRLPAMNKTRQTSMASHIHKPGPSSTTHVSRGIVKSKAAVGVAGKVLHNVSRNANLHDMLYSKKHEASGSARIRPMQEAVNARREKLRDQKQTSFESVLHDADDAIYDDDVRDAGIVAPRTSGTGRRNAVVKNPSLSGDSFHPSMFGLSAPIRAIPFGAASATSRMHRPTATSSEDDIIVID